MAVATTRNPAGLRSTDGKKVWLTAGEAQTDFPDLTKGMLDKWRSKRCPYLPKGRRVKTKPNPGRPKQFLYLGSDLVRAVAVRAKVVMPIREPKSKWIWAEEAEAILTMDRSMLSRYVDRGCAALGGRKLTVRRPKVPEGWGKGIHFPRYQYLRSDVEQIAATRGDAAHIFEDRDGKWLAAPLAAATYSMGIKKLSRLGKDGKARRQWRTALTGDGVKLRGMFFYLESDLKTLSDQSTVAQSKKTAAEWAAELAPGWPMAKEAAVDLGVSEAHVGFWARKKCPYLPGGKKLRSRRIRLPGRRRSLRVCCPDDVATVKAVRNETISVGASRLTCDEAKEVFGFSRGRLDRWRKRCPFLKGGPLKTHLEDRPLQGEANARRRVLTFSRDDLEEIQRRKVRQSYQWLAASTAASIYGTTEQKLAELTAKGTVRRKWRFSWDQEAGRQDGSFFYCPEDLQEEFAKLVAIAGNGSNPAPVEAAQPAAAPPAAESPAELDGPVEPGIFRYDAEPHALDLQDLEWRLLVYFWERLVGGDSIEVEVPRVAAEVWKDRRVVYSTMKPRFSRLNRELTAAGIPLEARKPKGGNVVRFGRFKTCGLPTVT